MVEQSDVALAFGLVLGAGAATALGAASVWVFRPGVDLRLALACSLGLSAGVMIYISFVEIFAIKSIQGFSDAGYDDAEATRFATLCFFGGMALLWVLDKVVHSTLHLAEHSSQKWARCFKKNQEASGGDEPLQSSLVTLRQPSDQPADAEAPPAAAEGRQAASTVPLVHPPAQPAAATGQQDSSNNSSSAPVQQCCHACGAVVTVQRRSHESHVPHGTHGSLPSEHPHTQELTYDTHEAVAMILRSDTKNVGLSRTGLLAAMAIGLHNLPEGLATFVAALADPTAGVVLALAIALHNIPEGVVVAMPIYIASGSKIKGFMWGCLSGVTEPIGALIGYAVLGGGDIPPLAYGVMLGLVAGMMVWISLTELLPTAFKYDPQHTYSIAALIAGMMIMALSLMLFEV